MTMLKPRAPETVAAAVAVVIAALGVEAAAAAVSRSVRSVYNWSDPDSGHAPTVEQAVMLDAAYVRATGREAPIAAAYLARLQGALVGAADVLGDPRARLGEVMGEVGDVADALGAALADGRIDAADRAGIARAVGEAIQALRALHGDVAGTRVPAPPGAAGAGLPEAGP